MKKLGRSVLVLSACSLLFVFAVPEEDRGEGKESLAMKNRSAAPKAADIDANVTLAALLEKTGKDDFSEKKGAHLEGYVMQVEREEDGDMHIVLAPSESDTDSKRWVIVEMTTPWRKILKLTSEKLRSYRGKRVGVTGWLFYEPDAPGPDPRGTRWELHPVTSIEVLK